MPPHTEEAAVQEGLLLDAIGPGRASGMPAPVTADVHAAYSMC